MQDGRRRKAGGILLALLATAPAGATDTIIDPAARVGAVTALWATPDGGFEEHRGNCLLWTIGGRTYTIADLHTVMSGADGAPDRVADRIAVTIGTGSSRASLVWPPPGQRDARKTDMAILALE